METVRDSTPTVVDRVRRAWSFYRDALRLLLSAE